MTCYFRIFPIQTFQIQTFFNCHILDLPSFRCFLKNQVTEEDLYKYSGIFMVNGVTIGNIKGGLVSETFSHLQQIYGLPSTHELFY